MSTDITREEYERRFKAHIMKRLIEPEGTEWTEEEARRAAKVEWDVYGDEPDWMETEPETAADECLSYWEGDLGD